MEHALIIIHSEDILAAEHLVADLENYTVYFFDPILLDKLTMSKLRNIKFLPWENAPSYLSMHEKAHEKAYLLEKELDAGRHDVLPEISIYGWQHLNLYYLMMSMHWYSGLWNDLGSHFIGKHLHIYLCDTPSVYYFNSFIPALLLLQFARQHEIEFSGYTYGTNEDKSTLLPDLRGQAPIEAQELLLLHLPTCMYDMAYFNSELIASGKHVLNLEAKYFSVPVHAQTSIPLATSKELELEIPSPLRQRIEAFLTNIAAKLDAFFSHSLASIGFRERQVTNIVNIYRSQLLSYFHLHNYFSEKAPNKIVLSDHDTGFHGPIISFAEKKSIPVLLLPHSKTTPDLEFAYKNMHALVHPSQGTPILDRNLRRVPHFKLSIPSTLHTTTHFPAPIKSVGLMLNAFSLNGIYFANFPQYIAGIKRIRDFCLEHHLQLHVRCKPGYALSNILAKEVGLDSETISNNVRIPMAEFSSNCDLCIMYDTPTAGALEFLAQSIPIMNPILAPLTRHQAVIINPNTIARETLDECLARIASFKVDVSLFHQFKMHQFRSYVGLFDDTQPLRVFL